MAARKDRPAKTGGHHLTRYHNRAKREGITLEAPETDAEERARKAARTARLDR